MSIIQTLALRIETNSVLNCKKFSYCLDSSNNDEHVWATGRRARPSTLTNDISIHFSVSKSAPVQNLKKRVKRSESISPMNRFRCWDVAVESRHIFLWNLRRLITRLVVGIKSLYNFCSFSSGICIWFKIGFQQSITNIAA